MTLWQLRRKTAERLKSISGSSSGFEADQIIRFVFSKADFACLDHTEAAADDIARLDEIISRREAGEPLQYIFGEWDFMGLPFSVMPGVLIIEALAQTGAVCLLAKEEFKEVRGCGCDLRGH